MWGLSDGVSHDTESNDYWVRRYCSDCCSKHSCHHEVAPPITGISRVHFSRNCRRGFGASFSSSKKVPEIRSDHRELEALSVCKQAERMMDCSRHIQARGGRAG